MATTETHCFAKQETPDTLIRKETVSNKNYKIFNIKQWQERACVLQPAIKLRFFLYLFIIFLQQMGEPSIVKFF